MREMSSHWPGMRIPRQNALRVRARIRPCEYERSQAVMRRYQHVEWQEGREEARRMKMARHQREEEQRQMRMQKELEKLQQQEEELQRQKDMRSEQIWNDHITKHLILEDSEGMLLHSILQGIELREGKGDGKRT